MIIRKVAVGNELEAFIQESFGEGTNIIFSDDNNKGKTILIQSMMYCLGNEPIFPVSFDYLSYFHYIEFSEKDVVYRICRKGNIFAVSYSETLSILSGESEFKRFWDKHIFELPQIEKNGLQRIVDFVLLDELFFIGQDKRNTSNIINAGFYKKEDFVNTIFSLSGVLQTTNQQVDIEKTKSALKRELEKKEELLREKPILKSLNLGVRYLSSVSDKIAFEEKIKKANQLKDKIANLNSARNSSARQKLKYENVLKDLRSLNQAIDHCEVRCLDCQSTRIGFSTSEKSKHVFDVSTPKLRQEIISSIIEKIEMYEEEIVSCSEQINFFQQELQEVLSDEEISLEAVIACRDGIKDSKDVEQQIKLCDETILKLEKLLHQKAQVVSDTSTQQETILNELIQTMVKAYNTIDPAGNLNIDAIFTKNKYTFSGCEETIFYLIKLYAIAVITNHQFPIVIDSFRAEDLSTQKEEKALELFATLSNQKIFTTTLKKEEKETGKYRTSDIFTIDFTANAPSKMLSQTDVPDFKELLKVFAIHL